MEGGASPSPTGNIKAFTFPLFMFTYIPISVAAIFKKVEWKPIEHKIKTSVSELKRSA